MPRLTRINTRRIAFALIAVGALAGGTLAQEGPRGAATPEQQVNAAVAEMEAAEPVEIFAAARELEKLGAPALAPAKKALATASPRAKVGLARVLLAQKEKQAAIAVLESVVGGDDPVAAVLAAEMIQQAATSRDDVKGLKAALQKAGDPSVKIAVAKALRARAQDVDAERILKDYLRSDDAATRAEAALALAEIGNLSVAKQVLDELSTEPTERGKRARELLEREKLIEGLSKGAGLDPANQAKLQDKKIADLEAEVKALKKKIDAGATAAGAGVGDNPLLDELLRNVKLYYVDEGERIENKSLVDSAAKGMIGSLDPFSSYMTEKETKDFEDSMVGKYAGIGAVVSMDPKDKILTIIRPIYSGPAYRMGLRSLDKITEVEGESTFGKTVEELVSKLKGFPKTKVKIKVFRKGWQKERDFVLEREEIQLESVHWTMLPGKVGYLSLSQFGQNAEQEVENSLRELEAQGMRALVFDLRANPGGLLSAAVEIADKFLKDNKLIVYSKGRNEFIAPYREFRTQDAATHPDYPIVVLVNHASASASEIVAGALQDHKRATLVGENTFGKGSVQQLMKVKATSEKSTLRLTIAKYYLPSGRSIHRDDKTGKGGVDPDIVVESDTDAAWVIQEADKLLETQAVEKYVTDLWKDHKEKVAELARFDNFDPESYPGFDDFARTLNTRLERNHVRKLVRAHARRLVQDDKGKEFSHDLQEDVQLQRGVYELLKKLGEDASHFKEYAFFGAKFDKAPGSAKTDEPANGTAVR
jgi:C-terminal peptidase prc